MEYPAHEKLKEHQKENEIISEFLDFLSDKNLSICTISPHDNKFHPYPMSKQNLIGIFLDISPIELEEEKRLMLKRLREQG